MRNTREKLIESFVSYQDKYNSIVVDKSTLADHLIANGVTVQEWKPAKEPPKESGEYLVVIHKAAHATTLLYSAEEKSWYEVTVEYATNPDGEEIYTYYAVDWWMPMPEPPKGE